VDRAKELEHRVIVYCKANQDKKVIKAIDVVIKAYRKEKGIVVKDEQRPGALARYGSIH
jgi:hypothetical protein